jgi:GDP-mannose 6-dehydrogenase
MGNCWREDESMKISVFGLGYVGTVSGVCLAKEGHQVIGIDTNGDKVNQLNSRQTPIVEPGIADFIEQTVSNGSFRATTDVCEAVSNSDLSLVAVGTYSSADGSANLQSIYQVMDQIGAAIRDKNTYHSIVIRSTVPPGTTEVHGIGFGVGMNPEFLREGVALNDFYHPPFIVIGTDDPRTADSAKRLYQFLPAEFYHIETRQAEILKYSCNAFHGLKVAFANEIGRICKAAGVDGRQLMEIFIKDTILNVSGKYLMPGVPFGGSCLPKDIKALASYAESKGVRVPLLDGIMSSNNIHFGEILRRIELLGGKSAGIIGLTFKENTDDIRESPLVKVVRCLLDRGYKIKVYDENLNKSQLVGTNLELLVRLIPEFKTIKVDTIESAFQDTGIVIITNDQYSKNDVLKNLLKSSNNMILDLHGNYRPLCQQGSYYGFCW